MIQLIIGGKGSGKTKKMIDMINESAKTTPGNIVCIEKSMKLTYDIDHNARLIDVDEYKIEGYEMLYGFMTWKAWAFCWIKSMRWLVTR